MMSFETSWNADGDNDAAANSRPTSSDSSLVGGREIDDGDCGVVFADSEGCESCWQYDDDDCDGGDGVMSELVSENESGEGSSPEGPEGED